MASSAAHCHWRIAKVAKELAAATYEDLMRDNAVFSAWKRSNPDVAGDPAKLLRRFVKRKWGLWVEPARATLTLLLREPIDEKAKEEIMEVLILDRSLIRGRQNPAQVMGTVKQGS